MGFLSILPVFSRLSKHTTTCMRNISTYGYPLQFGITNTLLAEPLKKKKRLDPAILREREERKKRKLEKFIRRLEKHSKQLKPIGELEIPLNLKIEKEKRTRELPHLSEEDVEKRILLQKEWARYKYRQYLDNIQTIDRFISSQNKALQELKAESEELYNEALQIDLTFLPYLNRGPCHTPPIKNYDSPDGEYKDITFKYPGET
ncbi:PREDICTED: 39S ribosomal protein L40, mitochondrial [Polistes dominula]|uniref:Large ribosomal subunit protein mL40 n=1 Tax=Polistes dominula TaxID=743375 RepID=A0ABM1I8A8_POLDO|nr:PREDICTED: 39S ribosomal protein L40, mitochondrial [Polistes dominula]